MFTGPAHSQEKGTVHVGVHQQTGILGYMGEFNVSCPRKVLMRGSCWGRLGVSPPADSLMGLGGHLSMPVCGDQNLEGMSANPLFSGENGG